ncbi:hypothetical protein ADL30_04995 [Streptomyces sp. NRRL S-1521]|nr:hypothetical protein ADL30_04995 [Streptomyces sp. NRRL S-1521]
MARWPGEIQVPVATGARPPVADADGLVDHRVRRREPGFLRLSSSDSRDGTGDGTRDGAGEDSSRRPGDRVVPGRFRGPRRTPVPPGPARSRYEREDDGGPPAGAALSEQA